MKISEKLIDVLKSFPDASSDNLLTNSQSIPYGEKFPVRFKIGVFEFLGASHSANPKDFKPIGIFFSKDAIVASYMFVVGYGTAFAIRKNDEWIYTNPEYFTIGDIENYNF
jgi:hypothetical protein